MNKEIVDTEPKADEQPGTPVRRARARCSKREWEFYECVYDEREALVGKKVFRLPILKTSG